MNLINNIDTISVQLGSHYRNTFAEYGPTSKGVDWGENIENVETRFQNMKNLFGCNMRANTLLDVGCGYGAFLGFLHRNNIAIKYTGIDLVDSMIECARADYPNNIFLCDDIFNHSNRYDYIVCNGILTQKLDASIIKMNAFAKKLIKHMYSICEVGIAFNLMSTYVNYQADNLYYRNPSELMGWCMSELSHKIKIDAAYSIPYEYTVYIYK